MEKPDVVTEDHLVYLDMLRENGSTNMDGAGSYIQLEFLVSREDARTILTHWMSTFSERHPR